MIAFDRITAVAAALRIANIDTDMILPARFLTTISRSGLGDGLFHTAKQDPDFVLNRAPWDRAGILIALDNLGCGSSREHAPWALLDFGIRCVIAPGIADIFYNNCCKNGILPIILPPDAVAQLMDLAERPKTAAMTVDLAMQEITAGDLTICFVIDPARKADLLAGTDDIARSLEQAEAIKRHEVERQSLAPWMPVITPLTLG